MKRIFTVIDLRVDHDKEIPLRADVRLENHRWEATSSRNDILSVSLKPGMQPGVKYPNHNATFVCRGLRAGQATVTFVYRLPNDTVELQKRRVIFNVLNK
ncbi:hypothetical protein AKO1_014091 [Acrasis kona]|uniref:Uncharacterized protein n=1 Tax=Acrasis kona TaxID=1008807 RepID=A0AAW2Z1T3_9EUKA